MRVPHASNWRRAGSEVRIFSALDKPCLAAFVEFGVRPLSGAYRKRSQSADGGKDDAHHWASDSDLGDLEGDELGVANNASADFDKLQLEAAQ